MEIKNCVKITRKKIGIYWVIKKMFKSLNTFLFLVEVSSVPQ